MRREKFDNLAEEFRRRQISPDSYEQTELLDLGLLLTVEHDLQGFTMVTQLLVG